MHDNCEHEGGAWRCVGTATTPATRTVDGVELPACSVNFKVKHVPGQDARSVDLARGHRPGAEGELNVELIRS